MAVTLGNGTQAVLAGKNSSLAHIVADKKIDGKEFLNATRSDQIAILKTLKNIKNPTKEQTAFIKWAEKHLSPPNEGKIHKQPPTEGKSVADKTANLHPN